MSDHSASDTRPQQANPADSDSTENAPPSRKILKYKISKQQQQQGEPEAGGGRLDRLEGTLQSIVKFFQTDPRFASPQSDNTHRFSHTASPHHHGNQVHTDTTNHAMHEDEDILSLLPSDDAYQTDSSCSQQGEDKSRRSKRTSKESNLRNLTDDIADLQHHKKRKKDTKSKSLLDKFDTPLVEELGEPTNEVLKEKFKKYWDVDNDKQLSLITDEYTTPHNCQDELVVPQINTEVYRKIDPYVKRQDGYIKSLQTNLSKSSVAMLKITEEVLKAEENDVPIDGSTILKHALNSFSMLGHSKRFLTKHRRHVMSTTKNFPPVLKDVCHGDIPDNSKFIFGDDIQKSLKEA